MILVQMIVGVLLHAWANLEKPLRHAVTLVAESVRTSMAIQKMSAVHEPALHPAFADAVDWSVFDEPAVFRRKR